MSVDRVSQLITLLEDTTSGLVKVSVEPNLFALPEEKLRALEEVLWRLTVHCPFLSSMSELRRVLVRVPDEKYSTPIVIRYIFQPCNKPVFIEVSLRRHVLKEWNRTAEVVAYDFGDNADVSVDVLFSVKLFEIRYRGAMAILDIFEPVIREHNSTGAVELLKEHENFIIGKVMPLIRKLYFE